jgi:hypothetical protein
MLPYLTDARQVDGCCFWLRFNTGEEGVLDLTDLLHNAPGKIGAAFRDDPKAVQDFYLDPWPTLAWRNGYDIAPERLYELFVAQSHRKVAESHESYSTENNDASET